MKMKPGMAWNEKRGKNSRGIWNIFKDIRNLSRKTNCFHVVQLTTHICMFSGPSSETTRKISVFRKNLLCWYFSFLIIKISCVFFVGFPRPRASTTISKKEISGILVPSRSRWWNGILSLIARRTPSLSGRRRQFQKIKLMLCRAQVTNFFLFLLSFVFFSYIFILFLLVCLSDVSPDSLLRLERDTASLGALLKGGISRDLNKIRYFIYEYKLSGNITQCPLRVTMCD